MPRPIKALIRSDALAHNLQVARRSAGGARIWAVVKANAYGHGLERAVRALGSADGFAVLDLADALRIRMACPGRPVLLLEGFFGAGELALLLEHSITPVIHSPEQILLLERARAEGAAKRRIEVYLKVNSGMNRLGFSGEGASAAYRALAAQACVRSIVLMTHFSDADGETGVATQLAGFSRDTAGLPGLRSLANSAALLRFAEARADWVRPGIMLYGGSPFAGRTAQEIGLRPAMHLTTELIAVQSLAPGDGVGYGQNYKAAHAMRIGIAACGYADGYPRHAPNGTPVLVCGKRTGTVGRVSMDMMSIDLSGIPEARVGSEVTLWGDGLAADEVAAAAGTVSYELFCALAQRVPVIETGGAIGEASN